MAARHGHPRSTTASPLTAAMGSSTTNPFAIALALLGALAIVIAVRDTSRHSASQTAIRPVLDTSSFTEDGAQPVPVPTPIHLTKASPETTQECAYENYLYPQWPEGFNVSVQAAFILGEQKSGSTWLWELLNAHPCLVTSAHPATLAGAITTKETYYFTSPKIGPDARQFLVPWMGYNRTYRWSDEAWQEMGNDWFEQVLTTSQVYTASSNREFISHRSYTAPGAKLDMQCSKYYLLEATPHNLNSPVVAKRIKGLFPDAKFMAVLKEPAWRMRSAYNQFSKPFLTSCSNGKPADWCPVYRYYQLKLPTFHESAIQEIEYLKQSGCTFQDADKQKRDWMSCFGCAVMDPWKHKSDNINLMFPPYAPSAALSMYAPMLKAWSEQVPLDEMRVVNYQSLVDDPLSIVNQMLKYLGLEEYTQAHMDILQPQKLGFKGNYQGGKRNVEDDVNELLQEYFAPLNEQLDELLADHPIPWQPFTPHISKKKTMSPAMH